ncbi:DUF1194 domain-containing protein [Limimaricola cinnabarinus]|uniref:VWFA domain-containing protein n=2 Tax=Limimaricola cinnabarinus TaxID=1125964 RepID=A0A2G1MH11_9RHOB|nr:DUF1194 domain-containing protein [Limimaricola cinnabarinus]PHP28039.1 hypothetical protein CJ301_08635 [Limimaricola cinnabarinus]
MARLLLIALACALSPAMSRACETALVLAMDVSNSVDDAEYRLQVDGLADAMEDPVVIEAVLGGDVALAVLQWSAAGQQRVVFDWTQPRDRAALARLSQQVRATPRAFVMGGTAPAEALEAALGLMARAPDCHRRVIDVSGDGTPNDGGDVGVARRRAEAMGVTVNGLAIESLGQAITGFYLRHVATRDGFVITARGHRDYPRAMRLKLRRELVRLLGHGPPAAPPMRQSHAPRAR